MPYDVDEDDDNENDNNDYNNDDNDDEDEDDYSSNSVNLQVRTSIGRVNWTEWLSYRSLVFITLLKL